jgi:hypothetical protein
MNMSFNFLSYFNFILHFSILLIEILYINTFCTIDLIIFLYFYTVTFFNIKTSNSYLYQIFLENEQFITES